MQKHPDLDKYLISSVSQFLFRTAFSLPNLTCIRNTMRFTPWSTLKTASIISAVVLLSLIPAANADMVIDFSSPIAGAAYLVGTPVQITWYIAEDDRPLDGVYGNLFLMDGSGAAYLLAPGVSLLDDGASVAFPYVQPGNDYYIEIETDIANFQSSYFSLHG
ncbi:hypothetical protein DFH94DRAFT_698768 [Russula ochroleuca]|uniref:Uncharacterized protein n=1 Tax=Russula ochroleuca TaxID=152965 RepID=A0A9P5JVL2_9AGAM|nr:hypothetical protein DFH94DRAFT_698768 [Russula ochroleuca]